MSQNEAGAGGSAPSPDPGFADPTAPTWSPPTTAVQTYGPPAPSGRGAPDAGTLTRGGTGAPYPTYQYPQAAARPDAPAMPRPAVGAGSQSYPSYGPAAVPPYGPPGAPFPAYGAAFPGYATTAPNRGGALAVLIVSAALMVLSGLTIGIPSLVVSITAMNLSDQDAVRRRTTIATVVLVLNVVLVVAAVIGIVALFLTNMGDPASTRGGII